MSYDYQALVSQIEHCQQEAAARLIRMHGSTEQPPPPPPQQQQQEQQQQYQWSQERKTWLERAILAYQDLSQHCPMTPLLWMQYAYAVYQYSREAEFSSLSSSSYGTTPCDSNNDDDDKDNKERATRIRIEFEAGQLRLEALELGLQEFPGHALLHVHYVDLLLQRLVLVIKQQQQQQSGKDDGHDDDDAKDAQQGATSAARAASAAAAVAVQQALSVALESVGRGSHQLEGMLIAVLFRMQAYYLDRFSHDDSHHDPSMQQNNTDNTNNVIFHGPARSYIQRSRVPMLYANDDLMQEFNEYCTNQHGQLPPPNKGRAAAALAQEEESQQRQQQGEQRVRHLLEQGKKCAVKVFGPLQRYEQDIEVAMHRDGVLTPAQQEVLFLLGQTDGYPSHHNNNDDDNNNNYAIRGMPKWDVLLTGSVASDRSLPGMGYGGVHTAQAFVRYVQALQKSEEQQQLAGNNPAALHDDKDDNNNDGGGDDHDEEVEVEETRLVQELRASLPCLVELVLERGVAECPTVELLWLFYLKYLHSQIAAAATTTTTGSTTTAPTPQQQRLGRLLAKARSVAARAVRNCPYSVQLVQQQLKVEGAVGQQQQQAVVVPGGPHPEVCLDPDVLLDGVIQPVLDRGFLPAGPWTWLELHQTAILTVKRAVLSRLAATGSALPSSAAEGNALPVRYDEAEAPDQHRTRKKTGKSSIAASDNTRGGADALSDLVDMVDDMEDWYDEVDRRLLAKYSSWSEGRSWLAQERGQTEAWLLTPLRRIRASDEGDEDSDRNGSVSQPIGADEACRALEKAVRIHNPPHPDTYLAYIRQWAQSAQTQGPKTLPQLVSRLRQLRFLFQRAVQTVGRPKHATAPAAVFVRRDFDVALTNLCHEWMEFERLFGSDESVTKARTTIRNKFGKMNVQSGPAVARALAGSATPIRPATNEDSPHETGVTDGGVAGTGKRKRHDDEVVQPVGPVPDDLGLERESKKAKYEPPTAEALGKKTPVPKVKIGNLEYPAHPYTIRVSNLSPDTSDMDLVDLFRPKCGAVVHARIMRERHQHHDKGKSKGWGLVQFEERESVSKALELHDVLGLHEKLLRIEHSHMPAASLVPPGMHRVNPKGEGTNSKRSAQKHTEQAKPPKESAEGREDRTVDEDHSVGEQRAFSTGTLDPATLKSAMAVDYEATRDGTTASHTKMSSDPPKWTLTAPPATASHTTMSSDPPKVKLTAPSNVLAFRPRGVARASHPKSRIKLQGKDEKGKK